LIVSETNSITVGELILILLLTLTPTLLLQMFALALVGRIRVLGWIIMLSGTLILEAVVTLTTFFLLDKTGMSASIWVLVPCVLVGTALTWVLIPWKRWRFEN
jgi:hypothetical protein